MKPYLPIEYLRGEQSKKYFQGSSIVKTFQSSGTTAETRSLSHFSEKGLALYKEQSLKIFQSIMQKFYGDRQFAIQGISLIPSSKEWPSSSLAQMLTWISEFWKLRFVNIQDFKKLEKSKDPLWIFATPFQLIDLFDEGVYFECSQGSILFETGGTKGKTRDLQRNELYELITQHFHISLDHIVSEYGMCELATQAYDYTLPKQTRRFRFPDWVKTYVLPGLNLFLTEGEGALVVEDPLRVDYPLPLRTQDVVRLYKDGSFEIIGRVPRSVLKGCSLLTETEKVRELHPKSHKLTNTSQIKFSKNDISYFFDNDSTEALSRELTSLSAAQSAISDLKIGFESTDWDRCVANSQAIKGEHWLFIAPSNHSIAVVYPLIMGLAAGLKMTVRIPKEFEADTSFLKIFLRRLSKFANISTLSHEFRLGTHPLPKGTDKVLIFGDSETVQTVKLLSSVPVSGFGSGLTVNVLENASKEKAKALAKDMLNLGQKGCMSSRALFILARKNDLEDFLSELRKETKNFWDTDLSTMQRVAVDHEIFALENKGFACFERKSLNDCLFAVYTKQDFQEHVMELFSMLPFVLPIFVYDNLEALLSDLKKIPSLICVSADSNLHTQLRLQNKNIRICNLGEANAPLWDGLHNGKALFSAES